MGQNARWWPSSRYFLMQAFTSNLVAVVLPCRNNGIFGSVLDRVSEVRISSSELDSALATDDGAMSSSTSRSSSFYVAAGIGATLSDTGFSFAFTSSSVFDGGVAEGWEGASSIDSIFSRSWLSVEQAFSRVLMANGFDALWSPDGDLVRFLC